MPLLVFNSYATVIISGEKKNQYMLSCRHTVFVYVLFLGDLSFIGIPAFLSVGTDNTKAPGPSVRDPKDRALPPEPSKTGVSRTTTGSTYTKPPTSQSQG